MCLYFNYGVRDIFGIKYGYRGFYQYDWTRLTVKDVKEIQRLGGTVLGSSRGGFDKDKIIENLIKNEITHVNTLSFLSHCQAGYIIIFQFNRFIVSEAMALTEASELSSMKSEAENSTSALSVSPRQSITTFPSSINRSGSKLQLRYSLFFRDYAGTIRKRKMNLL